MSKTPSKKKELEKKQDKNGKLTTSQKVGFIVASIFFSIVLLELLLRVLPKEMTKIDYNLVNEDRIFSSSRDMKFRPNLTRVWTSLGRPTIWHFNELGYRERPIQIDKPSNIYRIVMIGDSIVMGFGVEEYQSLPRRLEDKLRPQEMDPAMTHFEVLNLGIQGYALPHYYSVFSEDAVKMQPNVAIVAFYTNDILEAASFEANKKYTFLKSLPDIIPYKAHKLIKKNSRLYLFLLTKYYSEVEKTSVKINADEKDTERGWQLTSEYFGKMAKLAAQKNIILVIVGIPNSTQEIKNGANSQKRVDTLTQIAKENNLNYFDLYSDLMKHTKRDQLYLDKFDDHFSIEGNDYVAGLVASYLKTSKIIPEK